MAAKKAIPFVVDPQHGSGSRPLKKRRPSKRKLWPRFTLEEAFSDSYLGNIPDDSLNTNIELERGLRSVGFLLRSLSHFGDRDIAGSTADGLASILEHYASRIGGLAHRNPPPRTGGRP